MCAVLMPTRVSFTPLSGTRSSKSSACCYLLELDDLKILLDCGLDDAYDVSAAWLHERLAPIAPNIDAVLLTHGDAAHLGALPYARARFGLTAPVYATIPVRKMGQLCMYDAHATALIANAKFDSTAFSLDDVDEAFDGMHELKFAQVVKLTGRTAGTGASSTLTIAPHPAGHTVGGCFWRITAGAEDILYCPEYNHQNERHLSPGTLHAHTKPTLLVAPARTALAAAQRFAPRAFADLVAAALQRGGDVLVPSDAAGRSLELVQVLEAHWRARREVRDRPIVLLHPQAHNVLSFARSQIEWMGDEAVKAFDSRTRSENLFELRHVHPCTTLREVAALPSPKVVIATSADLSGGFAAELLPVILAQPKGLLLLTRLSPEHSPAAKLAEEPTPASVELSVFERAPLSGDELEEYERSVPPPPPPPLPPLHARRRRRPPLPPSARVRRQRRRRRRRRRRRSRSQSGRGRRVQRHPWTWYPPPRAALPGTRAPASARANPRLISGRGTRRRRRRCSSPTRSSLPSATITAPRWARNCGVSKRAVPRSRRWKWSADRSTTRRPRAAAAGRRASLERAHGARGAKTADEAAAEETTRTTTRTTTTLRSSARRAATSRTRPPTPRRQSGSRGA